MKSIGVQMFRKKPVPADIMTTNLNRCLTTLDLAMLMLGIMTGASIYNLPGQVAVICAGPSTFIALAIAGAVAFLNIICFAEFGSKLPKINGVYIYSYIIYGEIIAFIVAWCSILHMLLIMVYSSRNCSGAIDVVLNHAIQNATMSTFGKITGDFYPDFLAAAINAAGFTVAAIGPRTSSTVNKIFTTINLTIFVVILIASFYMTDIKNWQRSGLFPFGVSSITCSVARSYKGFQNFPVIFAYCDEVRNPRKALKQSVPILWIIVLFINVLMGISLTLMVPYELLDLNAPHSSAFIIAGMRPFAFFVSFATVVAGANFLLSASFASSRFVYALALDGLLFSCFANVNSRTKTPLEATFSLGFVVFILTLCLDIAALLELIVIDSLIFSALIAAAVLVVRYSPVDQCPFPLEAQEDTTLTSSSESINSGTEKSKLISLEKSRHTENIGKLKIAFKMNKIIQFCERISPISLPNTCIVVFVIMTSVVSFLLSISNFFQLYVNWIFWLTISILFFIALLPMLILALFEDNKYLGHIQVYNKSIYFYLLKYLDFCARKFVINISNTL